MEAGIALLDAIVDSPPPYGGDAPAALRVRMANELVAACLDEYRHIEALDLCGPRKNWRRIHVRETEVQMRQLHEQWLAPARELLGRVGDMLKAGQQIERFEEMQDAVGLTRVLLMTTMDDIERGREQYRNGQWVTLEEARRELRAAAGR